MWSLFLSFFQSDGDDIDVIVIDQVCVRGGGHHVEEYIIHIYATWDILFCSKLKEPDSIFGQIASEQQDGECTDRTTVLHLRNVHPGLINSRTA